MKTFHKNYLGILLAALLGTLVAAAGFRYSPTLRTAVVGKMEAREPSLDPFEEMERMQQEIDEHFESFAGDKLNSLDNWFGNRRRFGNIQEVSKKEDDQFVYFDIKVEGLSKTSQVTARIENQQIVVNGTVEKKEDDESRQSRFTSTFQHSFPVPENVDTTRMEMNLQSGKVELKFPKSA
jgi:HSP20 family molecular chaperone IbpA